MQAVKCLSSVSMLQIINGRSMGFMYSKGVDEGLCDPYPPAAAAVTFSVLGLEKRPSWLEITALMQDLPSWRAFFNLYFLEAVV